MKTIIKDYSEEFMEFVEQENDKRFSDETFDDLNLDNLLDALLESEVEKFESTYDEEIEIEWECISNTYDVREYYHRRTHDEPAYRELIWKECKIEVLYTIHN